MRILALMALLAILNCAKANSKRYVCTSNYKFVRAEILGKPVAIGKVQNLLPIFIDQDFLKLVQSKRCHLFASENDPTYKLLVKGSYAYDKIHTYQLRYTGLIQWSVKFGKWYDDSDIQKIEDRFERYKNDIATVIENFNQEIVNQVVKQIKDEQSQGE